MEKIELVFIPFSGAGHLAVTIELAKMMTCRDSRLSITIVIMKFLCKPTPAITSDSDSVRFLTLPPVDFNGAGAPTPADMIQPLKAQIPLLRDAVGEIMTRPGSARLGGFVLDMFCTSMIDVADEFGVPSYIFFTCGAAFLGFIYNFQFLHDNRSLDLDEIKDSDAELEIPSYANPVPCRVFPSVFLDKESGFVDLFLNMARAFRQVKGIIMNTFVELESHAISSLSDTALKLPPVYPVGPIITTHLHSGGAQQDVSAIISWLDDQPSSSVIYLCFGSTDTFGEDQVKEIAHALEHSGHRFLWSIRRPSSTQIGSLCDYENLEEVLPEGFLDRTVKIGKVIGWAPQAAILAHSSIGGFVSHCGWNSTLESIWYGVPVATWPLFAEQQLNAFQLVKDLGLAVEIKMDYHKDIGYIVSSQDIEIGLRNLMNTNSEVRDKREKMKNISRKVMMAEGSSYLSLDRFIKDVMVNIS